MTIEDIFRMAREADLYEGSDDQVIRFAYLVAAAEREKLAKWMMQRGYATGHGDTTEDLLQELGWQIAENWNRALINGIETEREACAKVCEGVNSTEDYYGDRVELVCAEAIRERGQK